MSEYAGGFIAIALIVTYVLAGLSIKYNWKIKDWF